MGHHPTPPPCHFCHPGLTGAACQEAASWSEQVGRARCVLVGRRSPTAAAARKSDAGVAEQRWSSNCVTVTGLCRAAEAGGRKARCPMWVDVNLVHTDILGSVNFWTSSPFHPLPSPQQPQAERSVWMKNLTPSFAGSFVLNIADICHSLIISRTVLILTLPILPTLQGCIS